MLTVWHFSIFSCKEYNQSDFSIDHLVMSICRVFSCVAGRGCLLGPVCCSMFSSNCCFLTCIQISLAHFLTMVTYHRAVVCMGLPWWLSAKEFTCQCRRHEFYPLVRKIPWKRKRQPTPVFLPGKSHRQRGLAGYSLWDCKRVR